MKAQASMTAPCASASTHLVFRPAPTLCFCSIMPLYSETILEVEHRLTVSMPVCSPPSSFSLQTARKRQVA